MRHWSRAAGTSAEGCSDGGSCWFESVVAADGWSDFEGKLKIEWMKVGKQPIVEKKSMKQISMSLARGM